jgi:hypothetical protein
VLLDFLPWSTLNNTVGRRGDQLMTDSEKPFFLTRGVVVLTQDILTGNWVDMAKQAQLTTIATHMGPAEVARFLKTEQGGTFVETCRALRIHVEHELHAIGELLPRELFAKDPSMFRMNEQGQRTSDANLCVHSQGALRVVCENALSFAKILRPTTGRYFFWADDAKPMCRCPQCRGLSDSDQALILENELIGALRTFDSKATLAHLAYHNTLMPPSQIKPAPGVFLEFAPIQRSYQVPLRRQESAASDPKRPNHAELLEALDANLRVFGVENAQVLEYWLDVSLFSNWKREKTVKLSWDHHVLEDDLRTYSRFGIRHVTSFACWIDGDYITRFGKPPVQEYGNTLLKFKWSRTSNKTDAGDA